MNQPSGGNSGRGRRGAATAGLLVVSALAGAWGVGLSEGRAQDAVGRAAIERGEAVAQFVVPPRGRVVEATPIVPGRQGFAPPTMPTVPDALQQFQIPGAVPPPPMPGDGLPEALPGPGERIDVGGGRATEPPEPEELILPVDVPESRADLILNRSKLFRLSRTLTDRTIITVDNPAVVEVRPIGTPIAAQAPGDAGVEFEEVRYLEVFGLAFGDATIRIIDEGEPGEPTKIHAISVRVTIDAGELEDRINSILAGADVRVSQVAQNLVLEGQVSSPKVMDDVIELIRSELRIAAGEEIARGSLAGSVGLGQGAAGPSAAGGGATSTSVSGGAAAGLASTPGAQPGLILINRVRVRGPRQVMLKVKIAELNRTALRQLGVNFQRLTDGDNVSSLVGNISTLGTESQVLFADPLDTQLFGIFDEGDFRLFLNALRQNELARILAQPTLMTLDGQPARFLAGGSFPFPVPQIGIGGVATITIEFRDFGALLEFLPMILEDDTIRLDVQPIFSELNPNTGVQVAGTAVPGLTERSARTVVQLREGQTLAIAGLFSTRTAGSTIRVPLLGDLPIVGPAFSRNVIQTNETELLVLVTPELVEAVDAPAAPAPGDLLQEPNDLEFFFLGRLEGKTRYPHRATTNYLDPFQVMKHFRSEDHWVVGPHGFAD